MNQETRFLTFMGLWLIFGVSSWIAFKKASVAKKPVYYKRVCIAGGFLFATFFPWVLLDFQLLFFTFPPIVIITAINLWAGRFCPECGTFYQHLGSLDSANYCRFCGQDLRNRSST